MSTQRSEQPVPTAPMSQTQNNIAASPHSPHHTQNAPLALPSDSAAAPHQPNDSSNTNDDTFIRHASEKVLDGAEEQVGEQAVTYVAEDGKQEVEDAKEKAQGLWAKYCGCFSSLA